jgi:hypothetical protein
MRPHLLTRPILVDRLVVPLKTQQKVTRFTDLHQLHLVLNDSLLFTHILKPEKTFLVSEVYVSLVHSFGELYEFHLLFVQYFVRLFGVIFQQVLRLVNRQTASFRSHDQRRTVIQ